MNKQNSNKAAILKYMLIVPLVLSLVLVANAQSVVKKTKKVVATTSQKSMNIVHDSKNSAVQIVDSTKNENKIKKIDSLQIVRRNLAKMNQDAVVTYDSVNKVYKSTALFSVPVVKKDGEPAEEVYEMVEKMPQYPGGESELLSYIAKNVRYPVVAQQSGAQGIVLVRFIVYKDGKVTNAKILKTIRVNEKEQSASGDVIVIGYESNKQREKVDLNEGYKAMENESLRVVNAMQQWTPGEQKGKKVAVYYTLPIKFKLE